MKLRLSTGSAVHLGLLEARMEAHPTTLYTMLGERCVGRCHFCTQAQGSTANRKFLSRIAWPTFDLEAVLPRLERATGIGRLCIQTLLYPHLHRDLLQVLAQLRRVTDLPISVCMNPASRETLLALKAAGVERVGVGLDVADPDLFARLKPGFRWDAYLRAVEETREIFGVGSVHLIAGLGETDEAMIRRFWEFTQAGSTIALFAFTPVRGIRLHRQPPPIGRYRALQLARHLIAEGLATQEAMRFREGRLIAIELPSAILEQALASGRPFRTGGCPACNRPLYNERPGGPTYNYPRPLTAAEKAQARAELTRYLPLPY